MSIFSRAIRCLHFDHSTRTLFTPIESRWLSSTTEMTERTQVLAATISGSASSEEESYRSKTLNRRMALSKAITLIESKSPQLMRQADLLMNHLAEKSKEGGNIQSSFRVGISGPPGAGKFSHKLFIFLYPCLFVP